jgi:hypothetical protein
MNKASDPYSTACYAIFDAIPKGSLVCPVRFDNNSYYQHFDKFAVAERGAAVPMLFSIKHIGLRYREPLPEPPRPAAFTDAMLKTYPYFLVHGASPFLDSLVALKVLKIEQYSSAVMLFRNTRVTGY